MFVLRRVGGLCFLVIEYIEGTQFSLKGIMGLNKINHIGIAVEDLAQSIEVYKLLTGRGPHHCEEIKTDQVKTAFFKVQETNLELLQATSPESPIAKFIKKQGRGGIHHICIEVDDLEAKLTELKNAGVTLIDKRPRQGAHDMLVAFVHPKSMGGVLIELAQHKI